MSWDSLIRFLGDDQNEHWAALPLDATPASGIEVDGFSTIEDLEAGSGGVKVTVQRVCETVSNRYRETLTDEIGQLLAPVPATGIPIVCVGLNYRNHANEASLPIPATPPMWYKPAASLADPGTEVPFPVQAQKGFPDFEVCHPVEMQ